MKFSFSTRLMTTLLISGVLMTVSSAKADDSKIALKLNGFGSAYYGQAFSNDFTPYGFSAAATAINNKANFTNFSLVGADLSAKFSDDWSAAAEVISSGEPGVTQNYQTFAQWAFVTYKPTDNTSIRLGRQRFPIFTASEFVNTHAELPYREIPAIVYKTFPFSTFDGASATQVVDVGIGKLSVGVFGGTPILDYAIPATYSFDFNSLIGAKLTLDGDGWRVRVQGSSYVCNANLGGEAMNGTSHVYSFGYRYDKHNVVTWGEYAVSTSADGTVLPTVPGLQAGGAFAGASEAGYVLIGYRLGQFLPRYTFANAQQSIGLSSGQIQTHTLGLNYAFNDYVVGKVEYEYDKIPSAQGGVVATQSATSTANNTSALFAGVDFKF